MTITILVIITIVVGIILFLMALKINKELCKIKNIQKDNLKILQSSNAEDLLSIIIKNQKMIIETLSNKSFNIENNILNKNTDLKSKSCSSKNIEKLLELNLKNKVKNVGSSINCDSKTESDDSIENIAGEINNF